MARQVLFAMMLALGLAGSAQAKPPMLKVGDMAPDATLELVKGKHIKLSDLRGQVVVINFWATWCVPCRTELPTLDAYYIAQKRFGLRVFAVTTENSVTTGSLLQVFKAMSIDPLWHLRGPYAPINDMVPTNFIIDRAGRIRYAQAGAFALADLNRELVPLLLEPMPEPALKQVAVLQPAK